MGLFDNFLSSIWSSGAAPSVSSAGATNPSPGTDSGYGGILQAVLPTLIQGGLLGIAGYQSGKREDATTAQELALREKALAQQKELALLGMQQAAGAAGAQIELAKKKAALEALISAAGLSLRGGEGGSQTLSGIGNGYLGNLRR